VAQHYTEGSLENAPPTASDLPHGDPSAEENYVTRWRERSDMPERVKEKILGKNAERIFRL
jgi:predicted TIM-barrel fold metal-dependent hydrolase